MFHKYLKDRPVDVLHCYWHFIFLEWVYKIPLLDHLQAQVESWKQNEC